MGTEDLLVDVRDVEKSFRGIQALRGVSLQVAPGETIGLVGPNGAGKSTLVNVIAGVHHPDAGTLTIAGHRGPFTDPLHARRQGVLVVPQEIQMFPGMSASANLSAGLLVRKRSWVVTRGRDRRLLEEIGERLHVSLADEQQLGLASAETQRLIMVGQALLEGARVLILDEPTAGLTPKGCEAIYAALSAVRRPDMAVIYVTHKFDEVCRLCDRAEVIVDGLASRRFERSELTQVNLSAAVAAGASASPTTPKAAERRHRPSTSKGSGPLVIRSSAGAPNPWELPCTPGRIVAVAGLADSGVEQAIQAASGRAAYGVEVVDDDVVIKVHGPRSAALAGISLVGGQRSQFSFQGMSVASNVVLGKVQLGRQGLGLTGRKERTLTREALQAVGIDPKIGNRALATLSGGNQQRALFARHYFAGGRLFIVDDPTVGVDVNGRGRIHAIIREVAEEGTAVLLYSSDPEETVDLADEIYVFVGGDVVNHLVSPVSTEVLVHEMSRGSTRSDNYAPGRATVSAFPERGD